jgi:hypothetical protein
MISLDVCCLIYYKYSIDSDVLVCRILWEWLHIGVSITLLVLQHWFDLADIVSWFLAITVFEVTFRRVRRKKRIVSLHKG